MSQASKKANDLILKMSDEQLLTTWNDIEEGSLRDSDNWLINGIPVDHWTELVYIEMSVVRKLK